MPPSVSRLRLARLCGPEARGAASMRPTGVGLVRCAQIGVRARIETVLTDASRKL
jgi:hypothetical protein